MKTRTLIIAMALLAAVSCGTVKAQGIEGSPEYIRNLTAKWEGERFENGRPRVPDDLIERLKKVSIEEAWAELMKLGYQNQYEGDWTLLHEKEDAVLVGRVVTAQFMPMRPDMEDAILEQGKREGRMYEQKRTVSWVINSLVKGDVYVADTYNKEWLGTAIGSNLGAGVYNATGNGMITYGHIRDIERLQNLDGFNVWCKGFDPSYMRQTMLVNYNVPVRIGKAIALPGDVVLAKRGGVLFIPPHLVEHIVLTAEFTRLSDEFGEEMIATGVYTAGQIDSAWNEAMNDRFVDWLRNYKGTLPMTQEQLESYIKDRNF